MFKLDLTSKVKYSSSDQAQTKPTNNVQVQLAKDLKKKFELDLVLLDSLVKLRPSSSSTFYSISSF